ncbi:biopolymer transport protein ExbD/TolR [Zunongwangia profunda SM-A87]|uniref:Biopolymer transport protein ExbD/TolR n=1 Tax=Zunongwangia profunda (strain DSM 18752 / CCTCC AB 206139 / SM-A87) TaxID=655815 RepID=D5BCL8_ZUNPS|nr:biopolymer transport protein ExbD/TolR [Zunongwangia profunda]ADF50531.1 biopolymer transport protein ExbD/TolR [Zunongwangia profunda SM-A87]|tara:strand:- start:113 stop:514 length:402 start_codon:yes stop_codon:yes gene_type:complete
MKENLTILICFLGFSMGINAQSSIENNNIFYLNVFINANKTIYVEEEKTSFQDVQNQVTKMLRKQPFKLDQQIIFRIFGDKDLDMGYIIDVNAEMRKAIQENIKTERYLLETKKLNIDGQNWFQKIDLKALKQ